MRDLLGYVCGKGMSPLGFGLEGIVEELNNHTCSIQGHECLFVRIG